LFSPAIFWFITQRVVVIYNRLYRSHLQCSRILHYWGILDPWRWGR